MPQNFAILTPDARNGIFTYSFRRRYAQGEPAGAAQPDRRGPGDAAACWRKTPTRDKINNFDVGDGRNTGGYRFNQRNNELLDNVTGKVDYNISSTRTR